MKKLIATLTLAVATASVAQAAIINVTNANYRVSHVHAEKWEFDVDLVQNVHPERHKLKETLVRLNKDARCHIVHHGAPLQNVSRSAFLGYIHRGTRVRVTGGRTFSGNIDASEVWAEK